MYTQSQLWHEIDWQAAYLTVNELQNRIAQAKRQGTIKEMYDLQRKLIRTFGARAIAVRKVITNSGGKTAGVDNIVLSSPQEYYAMIGRLNEILLNPKQYKAKPLRRVMIPKANGGERPLGIPTIEDRAMQALYHLAVDPAVETVSDKNSFGFRKERSTHDAVAHFRLYMSKRVSPEYVLEADISKCFDRIDHDFLMKNTPICDREVLRQWLKSGIIQNSKYKPTEAGTPQGGIISPTLCNVALNGLEEIIKKEFEKTRKRENNAKVKVIRYADDVVITGRNPEVLQKCKSIMEDFIAVRGLELNQMKTKITQIKDGINLLGFNIVRKPWREGINAGNQQDTVLIIQPNEKGFTRIKERIKEAIKKAPNMTSIITELNPVIRGWTEHKRISWHSAKYFQKLNKFIWEQIRTRFVKSRPGRMSQRRNYKEIKGKIGFMDEEGKTLLDPARVTTIKYKVKRTDLNPYLEEDRPYFEKRREERLLSKLRLKVFKKCGNTCSVCGQSLLGDEKVELHHIKPKKEGGKNTVRNLQALHRICHVKITHAQVTKTSNQKQG